LNLCRDAPDPIFENDPSLPKAQLLGIGAMRDPDAVFLLAPIARMRKPVCQLAIVREEHQAFAIQVEPTHGKQSAD
jgi:hypothetical protein